MINRFSGFGVAKKTITATVAFIVMMSVSHGLSFAEGPTVTLPQGVKGWEKLIGLKGLSNVGRVAPGVYRGAHPEPEGYATLKKMGVKTVINLRMTRSEKLDVEDLGMQSVEIPLGVLSDVKPDIVNKVIDIMKDPARQPVYVHCRQGQDRTGIVVAAYRMRVEGWSLKEAEAEMQDYGFNDIWVELKEFVREYARGLGR